MSLTAKGGPEMTAAVKKKGSHEVNKLERRGGRAEGKRTVKCTAKGEKRGSFFRPRQKGSPGNYLGNREKQSVATRQGVIIHPRSIQGDDQQIGMKSEKASAGECGDAGKGEGCCALAKNWESK